MPPRQGQIDEMSEAIGRLTGLVESLDRYTHDREHTIANLTQKIDGIGVQIAREVGRLKGELQGDLASFKGELQELTARVTKLETARSRDDGVKSVWLEILKSPIVTATIGGLLGALGMAWALLAGKPNP
jgi:hypothetical protein